MGYSRIVYYLFLFMETGYEFFPRRGRTSTQPFEVLSERFIELSSPCTAANYHTALRSLRQFCGKVISFREVTPELVSRYEKWLRAHGVSRNTSSCYIRSLRALYNKVCEAYAMTPRRPPFKGAYTGVMRTPKRAVSRCMIKQLMTMELEGCRGLARTRDYFLFSLFACGMPFIDMAYLRKDQIKGDEFTYYRRKTGNMITVHIEKCLREIIERRGAQKGPFVFPILFNASPEVQFRRYRSQLALYNGQLKLLAMKMHTQMPLTSYTARHTWATMAYASHADVDVIGRGLGHTNERTTRIYINDMADKRLNAVNRRILDELHKQVLGQ